MRFFAFVVAVGLLVGTPALAQDDDGATSGVEISGAELTSKQKMEFAQQTVDEIDAAKTHVLRMIEEAQKNKDELTEDVYWDRLDVANRLADECKSRIQMIFNDTFGA